MITYDFFFLAAPAASPGATSTSCSPSSGIGFPVSSTAPATPGRVGLYFGVLGQILAGKDRDQGICRVGYKREDQGSMSVKFEVQM